MSDKKHAVDANPKAPNNLLEKEADARAGQVSNVSYRQWLGFESRADTYSGDTTIAFQYSGQPAGENVFVDFTGDSARLIEINGRDVTHEPNVWSGHRLQLKAEWLKAGSSKSNELRVVYESAFVKTGNGLFRCEDSEDKSEYVYSNFEPFECHRMMPCFDQPNIKAVLSLRIRAPNSWTAVLGNAPVAKTDVQDTHTTREFQDTQRISTYLFVAIAGQYEAFHDNSYANGRIPMSLYVRRTLAKHMDTEHLFDITKRGMAWYEKFFDFQYPFDKYDQIFVPELNIGAMEHPGAVTFTDSYIFKDKPSTAVIAKRCDTVLHEMAHMWFGNLVTMKWWDDLWLNESFATYMAALCVSEATDFKSLGWTNFNSVMKRWGMQEDELSTTHPVAGIVPDTDYAETNFDGVTYGKGAALLKQLVCCVGMDGFRTGVRRYFKKYAWGNTVCVDFVNALSEGEAAAAREKQHKTTASAAAAGSGALKLALDPKVWSAQWLATASMNTLAPTIKYSEGKEPVFEAFTVSQTYKAEYPTLRQHALEVGLFDWNAATSRPVLRESVRVTIDPVNTTDLSAVFAGKKRPDFVFLNYDDHGFAKFPLDPLSFGFVTENIDKFEDPYLRQLLYTEVYYMARDQLIPSTDFLDLIVEKLDHETDPKLVETFLIRAQIVLSRLVPDNLMNENADSLFDLCFKRAITATTKEWHTIWTNAACSFMYQKTNVSTMASLLEADASARADEKTPAGGKKLGSFPFTQRQRWSIVRHAMAWSLPNRDALLAAESARDKSDSGAAAVLATRTSAWDAKVKADAWARYMDPATQTVMRHHQIAADMSGFLWRHQRDILHPLYTDKFFATVKQQFSHSDNKEFCKNFVSYLLPFRPEDKTVIARTRELLASANPNTEKRFVRSLQSELDDLERARRCRSMIIDNTPAPAASPKRKLTAPLRIDRGVTSAAPIVVEAAPNSASKSSDYWLYAGAAVAAVAAIAGFVYFRSSTKSAK